MSKRFFITYGDAKYRDSLKRIGKEAEALHLFDRVVLYSERDLPDPFKKYAEIYPRGGGYWMWKPYIIHRTLQDMEEGDVLVYADAGCTLLPHNDWNKYFDRLKHREALFFVAEGKNKRWCKHAVFMYFTPKCPGVWKAANQIQATVMCIRKTASNEVIARWYEAALRHPELFTDADAKKERPGFREHRHDQSVLTACICTSPKLGNYFFTPEKIERRYKKGQAILASRISGDGVRGTTKAAPVRSLWLDYVDLFFRNLQKFKTLFLFRLAYRLNR